MMKLLLCLLILAGLTSHAQTPIHTQRTAKHINIPGTRLYLVPPPGFKVSTTMVGLEKDKVTNMMVMDIPGGNYDSNLVSFSRQEFESKGISVLEEEDWIINGLKAKYILMQGDPFTKVQGLFFGDSTFTTLIMAPVSTKELPTVALVKESILSVWYDKTTKVDPFAAAGFTLNDKTSTLKFARVSAGLFIYTVNGVIKQSYGEEPFFTAAVSPIDKTVSARNIGTLMIASLQRNGISNPVVLKKSNNLVNGYEAYDVEISAEQNGQPCRAYQLVVLKGNKAVFLVGIARNNFDKTIADFKKLAQTIRVK